MRKISYRSLTVLSLAPLLIQCFGGSPPRVPAPVGQEFVEAFRSDGLSLEVEGDDLVAEVRDELATRALPADRQARAREMATWLWTRYGRESSASSVRLVFLTLTGPVTVVGEYRFDDLR